MKNPFKKIISTILTAVILLTAAPMSGFVGLKLNLDWLNFDWLDFSTKSSALDATGQCGDNVYWTFDESTGTLNISGTGDMYYFDKWNNYSPFYNNSGIKTVVIESGVTSIGSYAFYGCSGLKSVEIGIGVESIRYDAFCNCNSLTRIMIPDSVTSIGGAAFSRCTRLISVTIPDSVTSIGDSAFENTGYYMDSSNWENGVLYIGFHLIKADSSVSGHYNVKSGTKCLAFSAFSDCNMLTSVTIPDSVTSIGRHAFYNCYGLTSVNISSLEAWCSITFYYEYVDGEDLSNPLYYAHNLYLNGELVTDLIIPDSVTSIGSYTFYNCTGLTSITIPDSEMSIDDYAFYNCTGLTSVTISDSVTSIGDYAFYNCTGLTSVTIGNSVTSIGGDAFCGCTGLTSVTIGDNVTSIGYGAFSSCTGLTNITIPENVTNIVGSAFENCTGLTTVNYNAINCSSMGYSRNSSFYNCNNFTSLIIGANVESIPDYAFKACTNLQKIIFNSEDSLEIGAGAFDECYNVIICCKENSYMHYYADRKGMQYCIIDEGGNPSFTVENDILISYSGTGENIFVSTASKIGFGAFDGNENLKSVELASNVTRIYNQAFRNCTALEKVIIPKSVTSIGSSAFAGCDNLTIWCYAGSYAQAFAENHDIPYMLIRLNLSDSTVILAENETATLTADFTTDLIDPDKIIWTSSDPDVASVSGGTVTVYDCGETEITASTASGLSAVCTVTVDLKLQPSIQAQIDTENAILTGSGLVGKTDEEIKALFVNRNIAVTSSGGKAGTGDKVTLYKQNGDVYREVEIIVFGDVNSDGVYDGQDAFIVNCIANGMLTREQVGEAKYLAADCNHDGEVNSSDVLILEQAGLLLANVDQSQENFMETNAYAEYLDLIDQNPTADETPEIPTGPEAKQESLLTRIYKFIVKFLIECFNYIFPKV